MSTAPTLPGWQLDETKDKWATWWRSVRRPREKKDKDIFFTVLRNEAKALVALWSQYAAMGDSGDRASVATTLLMKFWSCTVLHHSNNSFFPKYCLGREAVNPAHCCRKNLSHPERVGYIDPTRFGPLHTPRVDLNEVARGGNADLMKLMLSFKEPRSFRKKKTQLPFTESPIHIAAVCGHAQLVAVLLKAGVFVDQHDVQGRTALDQAVHWGNLKVVQILVAAGADVKGGGTGSHGYWILHRAREVSPALVKLLVDAGAEVNCLNDSGKTPLHVACSCWGSVEAVKILLHAGAKVNIQDRCLESPLHTASEYSRLPEIVDLLIKAGADVNSTRDDGETALHMACGDDGSAEKVKLLIAAGADVNKLDEKERNPLHIAAFYGHTEVVKSLIAAGSKINTGGTTPLHIAARWGHAPTVQLLLDAGAHPNCIDADMACPLHYAAQFGHVAIVKALLAKKADLNVRANAIHKDIDDTGCFW